MGKGGIILTMVVIAIAVVAIIVIYYNFFLKNSPLLNPHEYELQRTKLSVSVTGCAAPSGNEAGIVDNEVGAFCGDSTSGSCSSDSDCRIDGRWKEVCRSVSDEESTITGSLWKDCYNSSLFGAACGCVEGGCQWAAVGKENKGQTTGTGMAERNASIEVLGNNITYSRVAHHLCCRTVQIEKHTDDPPFIKINEIWGGIGCKCECFSEINATISGMPNGTYFVSVYEEGTKPGGNEPIQPALIASSRVEIPGAG